MQIYIHTYIYKYTCVSGRDARGLIGRVALRCCTGAWFCSTEYKVTRHPASVPCDCVFSIFVNDTGLNFAHVQRGCALSLFSGYSFFLFLYFSLSLSLSPFFFPLSLLSFSPLLRPFSVSCCRKNFDQRRSRSRRTCNDQWGINARRGHWQILSLSLSLSSQVPRTTYREART